MVSGYMEKTMKIENTKIVETPEGPAVLLPEGFRFEGTIVTIWRDGELVILAPIKPTTWPEGFFEKIYIDDPTFVRPDQGQWTPPPVTD
jgi:virulence-associated protein VagC